MERGVDGGGSARHWRQRRDRVTALEVTRVCTLEFGFGEMVLWLWRNGLDFIECEIVRV